ncbi:MAG: acylphosphatase [Streptosporangiaceae bacterium]
MADDEGARLTAWVDGYVQGVGFRLWVRARAREMGLVGAARNLPDGRVEVVAEGPRDACRRLAGTLRGPSTPGRVTDVVTEWGTARGDVAGFGVD